MPTIAARPRGRIVAGAADERASAAEITALLADVRERTLALIAPLSDADLRIQHDPLMSPIVWDLGHIAGFEELWLVRHLERPFTGLAAIAKNC